MNLGLQNALYREAAPDRVKSRTLHSGTAAVRAERTSYLFQEKNENTEDYALRLKRAVLDNYVEKIVEARQSVLFMRPHDRDLDASLKTFENDVDKAGTGAASFFSDVARDAQIDGMRWVLVDMPRVDQPASSAAEEQAAGIRPFFQSVPAANVIDWAVGPDGALDWAVIQQYAIEQRQPGTEPKPVLEYKIWYRDRWELHRPEGNTPNQKVTQKYSLVAQGDNPTGAVPLVPFYGVKRCDFYGAPTCYSVLDHVILIYNKESDLDWFERLYCHPIPYVIAPKKPEKLDSGMGFHIVSGPQSGEIEVGYLQTTGAGENSVRDSINRIEAKIYAIALAQAKRDGKQVQAADSMREDRRVFTSSLKTVSEQLEHAETRCWKLMGAWLGRKDAKAVISYNRDFDDRTIDDTMLTALSDMVDGGKLTLETFLSALEYSEILPNLDAKKEQQTLALEASTRAVSLLGDLDKATGGA